MTGANGICCHWQAVSPTSAPSWAKTQRAHGVQRPLLQLRDRSYAGVLIEWWPFCAWVPQLSTPNPRQPRQVFDEEALEELAESIRVVGLLQPVVVRKVMPSHYELIMGERRWRACELAGLSQIPASVRETSTSDRAPSSIKTSSTPGSPFRRERAPSICLRVRSPPSQRTPST